MNRSTQQALNALNHRFYQRFAGAFDQSRHAPWAGWQRVIDGVVAGSSPRHDGPLRVLDVGCGNGRFGELLARRLGAGRLAYRGVDASVALLARARSRLEGVAGAPWGGLQLAELDLIAEGLEGTGDADPSEQRRWDLIAAFGLLHHLPGRVWRRSFLEGLARRLAPGGVLAVAIWRFGEDPRFVRRRLAWAAYNRGVPATERVDEGDLEPGDWLLRWGSSPEGEGDDPAVPGTAGACRYCHAVDAAEEAELVAVLEPVAPLMDRFDADGRSERLNRYLLFRAPT